jgi:prepilin-type N-terminal cleavage/methylation domain-containing protein
MKSIFQKNRIQQAGFTLIETLVAITILMISIVGPLTIASKGLTASVTSRDQVIASYLAQDALEYLKNFRDNLLLTDSVGGWNTFLTTYLNGGVNCISPHLCDVETAPTVNQGHLVSCTSLAVCPLYIDATNKYYTFTASGNTSTEFNRAVTVTRESAGGLSDGALVTVTVTWKNGKVTDQVVLNDMLFNTLR